MFLNSHVGALIEPLTGRRWDQVTIRRELLCRSAFLAGHGLEPGHRVFLHYGNTLEFFVDLVAVWMLGGTVIPVDQQLTRDEIETVANGARPRFSLWIDTPCEETAAALSVLGTQILQVPANGPDRQAGGRLETLFARSLHLDQEALILFKTGVEKQPRGVVHTHRSLRARWITLQQNLGLRRFRRTLCLLPTHSGHGLICNALFPWLSGQDLFVLPPFCPDLIVRLGALLDAYQITFMSSVPSLWRLALKTAAPPQRGTLEWVCCSSGPLSAHLWREVGKWSGAEYVLNAYGLVETGGWVAGTTIRDFTPEDGLIGVPWGAVVKILRSDTTGPSPAFAEECPPGEEGIVWLNTPSLMRGYLGRDDLTDVVVRQGWFMTGDIGSIRGGRLYLCGRAGEEINKGGMKVRPAEVDGIVERFHATKDVCAFATEDPLYGQNVAVAVVLDDRSDATLVELHGWARERLADHKLPTQWFVLDDIPRTSGGTVNREDVAQLCATLDPVPIHRLVKGTLS